MVKEFNVNQRRKQKEGRNSSRPLKWDGEKRDKKRGRERTKEETVFPQWPLQNVFGERKSQDLELNWFSLRFGTPF